MWCVVVLIRRKSQSPVLKPLLKPVLTQFPFVCAWSNGANDELRVGGLQRHSLLLEATLVNVVCRCAHPEKIAKSSFEATFEASFDTVSVCLRMVERSE